jgi:methionine synthase II (cobalamin-independent)
VAALSPALYQLKDTSMFDATIAGSLPRPDWLAEPEKLKGGWKLEGEALREGQNRAAREWIKHQECIARILCTPS